MKMGSRKSEISRAGRRMAAICVMLAWTLAALSFGSCRRPGQAVRIENEPAVSKSMEEPASTAAGAALEVEDRSASGEEETGQNTAVSTPAGKIYVHVCGQVRAPGVYELSEGSRVTDAVEAAGGFSPQAAEQAVNLAAHVSDGSKIVIPSMEEAEMLFLESASPDWYEEESRPAAAESGGEDGRVNINKADAGQLTAIPGIGQTRAEAIVAYREENGLFGTIEDIMKVTGIKDGLFGKIKDYITVGG